MIWTTTNGRRIPYRSLSTEHLCNILNLLERTPRLIDRRDSDAYFWLRTEAMRRGLRWRKFAGINLTDGDLEEHYEGYRLSRDRTSRMRASLDLDSIVGRRVVVKIRKRWGPSVMAIGTLESIAVLDDRQPVDAPYGNYGE